MTSLKTGDGERLTNRKFYELLSRPWYAALLLVGPGAVLALAVFLRDGLWAIAGPLFAAGVILVVGHQWAARKARQEVLQTFAAARGLTLQEDPISPTWTPLLWAGDERRIDVAISGTLEGMPLHLAHYTFTEITHSTDSNGNHRTTREDFDYTVASTDVTAASAALPTLYIKPDTGLFDIGDGWLNTGDMTRCETESVRFNKRYRAWHDEGQDTMVLRRFLDPSTVDTLANHPLHFGVEMAGGRLLLYIEGHCADSGELGALVDALATLRSCVLEAARVRAPAPAPPAL